MARLIKVMNLSPTFTRDIFFLPIRNSADNGFHLCFKKNLEKILCLLTTTNDFIRSNADTSISYKSFFKVSKSREEKLP